MANQNVHVTNIPYKLFVEPNTYFFLAILTSFFALTYFKQTNIGAVYLGLLVADFIAYVSFKPKFNFFTVKGNTIKSVLAAVAAYLGIVWLTGVAVRTFQSGVDTSFQLNMQRLTQATFGATIDPILSSIIPVTLVVFVLFIPVLETRVFTRLMEWLSSELFNSSLGWRDIKTYLIVGIVGAAAVAFHLQVKGFTNSIDLGITFVFFAVSMILVLVFREMESAIYLHMINNAIGIKSILGL